MARKRKKTASPPNSLSLRIQSYRLAAKLTQQQLADKLNVTQSYIASIERHPDFDPKVSTLRKIAAALGVDVIELLRDDEVASK